MKLWKGKREVGANLRDQLPQMVREYFAEGHSALEPGRSYEEIHHFRLMTKRFRYTLEIFKAAYGPGVERRIETLKKVQTFLGDVNDHVTTLGMLRDIPGTEKIQARLEARNEKLLTQLRAHWAKFFDAPGRQISWERYLERYACRGAKASPPQQDQAAAEPPGDNQGEPKEAVYTEI